MLLEQTYNADAKEECGLDGITLNDAARTKWVYTKPITAAISAQLKDMLHLNTSNQHHDSGQTRVARDREMVCNMMAAIETNPFTSTTSNLINVLTGQCADEMVKSHLTGMKELGMKALSESLQSEKPKTVKVRLETFHTQNAKPMKTKKKSAAPGKSDEIAALLRITQIVASGAEVDIEDFIGKHECSKMPPSLFDDEGNMRAAGTKASLVKALKESTGVTNVDSLPPTDQRTAIVFDAMFLIRKWSFHKGETFGAIADRYIQNLVYALPPGVDIMHFCCDRYNSKSLKTAAHQHRYKSRPAKVYEVCAQYQAPDPEEFFSLSANKSALLNFLCDKWCKDEQELPTLGSKSLYLGGGFKEVTKSVLMKDGSVTDVQELESTQEEADTRVLLHTVYSVQHDRIERVIIHANDTDVIVICIYYSATLLRDLPELWIAISQDTYVPIHELAAAMGPSQCRLLPFIHSLSGRDTTSYPFFTGKKAWLAKSKHNDLPALESFAEDVTSRNVTQEVISQAQELCIAVYTNKNDDFSGCDLSMLRTYKFLNSNSTLLKMLPPTVDTFNQHLYRSALATLIDKSAHLAKPNLPPISQYGWISAETEPISPVPTTQPAWPVHMKKSISCGCTKGCKRNCSCGKKNMACYIGCRCRGSAHACSRKIYADMLVKQSDDCSSADDDDE